LVDFPFYYQNNCLGGGSSPVAARDIWYKVNFSEIRIFLSANDTIFANFWTGNNCSNLVPLACLSPYKPPYYHHIDTFITSNPCQSYDTLNYVYLQFTSGSISSSGIFSFCLKPPCAVLCVGIYCVYSFKNCFSSVINSTVASVTPGNDGTAAVVISAGNAPYTYKWSTGSSDSTITGLSPGKYFVTIADRDSCTEVDSVTIEVASGERYKNLLPGITLFPNPATPDNAVNINISPQGLPVNIEFYDAAGHFYRRIPNITHRQAVVNITGFAPGVYIYKVLNKTGAVAVGKLVVR